MADITHLFPIRASLDSVFAGISTPGGLDAWWTLSSAGVAAEGQVYDLGFGPGYDWKAVVTRCVKNEEFELEMIEAGPDWLGTRVGFQLACSDGVTQVEFHHVGWPEANGHYRTSCFCWAMYLRILKHYVENGELVPYDKRLSA